MRLRCLHEDAHMEKVERVHHHELKCESQTKPRRCPTKPTHSEIENQGDLSAKVSKPRRVYPAGIESTLSRLKALRPEECDSND